jgi:prepilin-type N-terminal cleavage/methylation domain-containing protein
MSRRGRVTRKPNGYSLIELMIVVAIMGVVSSIALFQVGNLRPYLKGDGAMRTVIGQMNTARELSITQRRSIQVAFVGNIITLTRQDIPAGTTVLATISMEGGVQFGLTSGVPDTPDLYGNAAAASFGAATSAYFSSDGSLVDLAGFPVSGTIFLTIPNQPRGTRAVTVFGATGRIRGYRWDSDHAQWVRA